MVALTTAAGVMSSLEQQHGLALVCANCSGPMTGGRKKIQFFQYYQEGQQKEVLVSIEP